MAFPPKTGSRYVTHYIDQPGLEFTEIHLPFSPRCAPLCPAWKIVYEWLLLFSICALLNCFINIKSRL